MRNEADAQESQKRSCRDGSALVPGAARAAVVSAAVVTAGESTVRSSARVRANRSTRFSILGCWTLSKQKAGVDV